MLITIKKSLQLYYKQQMLIKDLKETKEELEKKNKEIQELENENIEISKKRQRKPSWNRGKHSVLLQDSGKTALHRPA